MKTKITTFLSIIALLFITQNNASAECSLILVLDISTSMSNPGPNDVQLIDFEKNIAKTWIESLDLTESEVAITAFCGDAISSPHDQNKPIQTFTNDKDSLMIAIDNLPPLCGGTNYNAAFLYRRDMEYVINLSALYYCKPDIAKYKPVIVFITDGNHLSQWGGIKDGGAFQIGEVVTLALMRNATIYAIVIGEEVITQYNIDNLSVLATIGKPSGDKTSNIWMNLTDLSQLAGVMNCQEVTAIDEMVSYTNQQVDIYPNPAGDFVNVKIPDFIESGNFSSEKPEIKIYDNIGNLIKKITNFNWNAEISISTEGLFEGIYFLNICSGNVSKVIPLIVLK